MERTLLLFLEYDGTDFCGWQRQPVGRSVQQTVESILSQLTDSPRTAVAAGRTDAGVHALAMPVSTRMPERWSAERLLRAMNALLPGDVAVRRVAVARDGTDARRSAKSRAYRYTVGVDAASRAPFTRRTLWPLGRTLDIVAMRRAAAALIGVHDFRAFAATGEPKPHYDCAIHQAEWEIGDGVAWFLVAADRFLHHMVRMLVGTMVDIGLGRRASDEMVALLARRDNAATSPPAPASGLTFMAAEYDAPCFAGETASW